MCVSIAPSAWQMKTFCAFPSYSFLFFSFPFISLQFIFYVAVAVVVAFVVVVAVVVAGFALKLFVILLEITFLLSILCFIPVHWLHCQYFEQSSCRRRAAVADVAVAMAGH